MEHELLPDWEACFSPDYLRRGKKYAAQGLVRDLAPCERGWTATVCGSESYRVFVPRRGSGTIASDASCTCPWFEKGHLCKHIAAVCIALESQRGGAGTSASSPAPLSLDELIAGADDRAVRELLARAAREDERLARRVRMTLSPPDSKEASRQLSAALSDIRRSYARRGFIDYRDALPFEHEYLDAIEGVTAPFMAAGDAKDLFELADTVVARLRHVEIDDSDGFSSAAMAAVERLWDRAFESLGQRPNEVTGCIRQLVKRSAELAESASGHTFDEFISGEIDEYLARRFGDDGEQAEVMLELVRRRIERAPLPEGLGSDGGLGPDIVCDQAHSLRGQWFHAEFERSWGARLMARAMFARGDDALEVTRTVLEVSQSGDVLLQLSEMLVDAGRTDEAIGLLENQYRSGGSTYDDARIGHRLRGLYRGVGDTERLSGLLEGLLMSAGGSWNGVSPAADLLGELRGLTPAAEWPLRRDELFGRMDSFEARCACLAAEGMADALMEEIEAGLAPLAEEGAGPYRAFRVLLENEKLLLKDHAPRVVEISRAHVERLMDGYASGRKAYQAAIKELDHLRGLPGGDGPAREVAEAWRAAYPRRRALMEELDKAGY